MLEIKFCRSLVLDKPNYAVHNGFMYKKFGVDHVVAAKRIVLKYNEHSHPYGLAFRHISL